MDLSTTGRADAPTGGADAPTGPAPDTHPPNRLPGMPQQRDGSTAQPASGGRTTATSAAVSTATLLPGPAGTTGAAGAPGPAGTLVPAAASGSADRPGAPDPLKPAGTSGSADVREAPSRLEPAGRPVPGRTASDMSAPGPTAAQALATGSGSVPCAVPGRLGGLPVRRLLPTPLGTPFTFGYAAVLAATSYLADQAHPAFVHALHQASSTDVAHLARHPVLVLIASALWIVGGIASPYAVGFLLVLTALERRTGTAWAAGVFLLGHVAATLATEVPVGLAVLAGVLPVGSLHRLDYGISFGVAASVGSLAGLLSPWLRWPLLIGFGSVLVQDLILLTDPVTDGGHLIALAIGVATWPLVRQRHRFPRPVARR
ncbi:rhomboid-like protein [Streptomyces sp. NPDC002742]|uniref:rhomboid-like protein n=1 Tax=Streptomyces sp. NPDC002742 TaxID=3364663 RepID=UPI00367FB937